jgi:hypothetical protein
MKRFLLIVCLLLLMTGCQSGDDEGRSSPDRTHDLFQRIHLANDEAVDCTRETAKENKPLQVIISGKDGKIQEEHSCGRTPYDSPGLLHCNIISSLYAISNYRIRLDNI